MIDTQKYCMARTSSWRLARGAGAVRNGVRASRSSCTPLEARRGRPNVTLNGLDSPLETGQTTDASVTATATRDRVPRQTSAPVPGGRLRAAAPTDNMRTHHKDQIQTNPSAEVISQKLLVTAPERKER